MTADIETFGSFVRRERLARGIGLREMAKTIGLSHTYVSLFECGKIPPPAEDKIRLIAVVIGCNVDELLAMAGKVSTDLLDIIKQNPVEMAAMIRKARTK